MFFALSKILFYLVMPITWILILLALALFSKIEKLRKRSLGAAFVLLLIFTNPFLINEALLLWEHPPTPWKNLEQYDAAIVLTGFTQQDKSPNDRVYTQKGADRILHPIRLYREGHVRNIVISGGGSASEEKPYADEARELRHLLICAGVPDAHILMENKSRNTRENALYTKEFLQQHPDLKKLLLVTSAFHIRRAKACFEKEGIQADVFSVDFYTHDRNFRLDKFIVPREVCLYYWQKLLHEILGYLTYKLVGYC